MKLRVAVLLLATLPGVVTGQQRQPGAAGEQRAQAGDPEQNRWLEPTPANDTQERGREAGHESAR